MDALRRHFSTIVCVDFEYYCPPGEVPVPLCLAATEMLTGRQSTLWIEGTRPAPLWSSGPDTLTVCYYASAEMLCYTALGWPYPARLLDLFVEFKARTSGRTVPNGHSLLGALSFYGLSGIAAADKEGMRRLAQRGGPYTASERDALRTYCRSDVDALARLLPVMLPTIDLGRALLRGRYMEACARMEWTGTPVDTTSLAALQVHWDAIRRRIALQMNASHPVFVPTGSRFDPQSRFGAAVLRLATARGIDPYHLSAVADQVWRETAMLYQESFDARRQARVRTGLTPARMARWEDAGHDSSSWPGLDEQAAALVEELPALGLGGSGSTGYGDQLWLLLRDRDERLPPRHDPHILAHAADLVQAAPEGGAWEGPLSFSRERFEQYLQRHDIPWPRLASGALDLDDETFRQMARSLPRRHWPDSGGPAHVVAAQTARAGGGARCAQQVFVVPLCLAHIAQSTQQFRVHFWPVVLAQESHSARARVGGQLH